MRTLHQFFVLLFAACSAFAQPAPGKTWRYELLADAGVMDECPICGRPSFLLPLRGSFDLLGLEGTREYRLDNISFKSDFTATPEYEITGLGTLSLAGPTPVANFVLIVKRSNLPTETLSFKNVVVDTPRIAPMLSLQADEDTQSLTRVYRLTLNAAPIQRMWFSTRSGFTADTFDNQYISDGALLDIRGSIFKTHSELIQRLSLPAEDFGLDAIDINSRGELLISLARDTESLVNGPIGHGSLLSSAGRVIQHNQQLLSQFNVVEQTDAGLDAIRAQPNDEYYFSISTPVTRAAGGTLRRGDILSTRGQVIRTENSLLARWQNPLLNSVGIDAFHIWPNGEVWFSLETGLESPLGTVMPGDIISDQGYFVFRNLELLRPFAPLEDTADFGLDALSIISDANANTAATTLNIATNDEGITLDWNTSPARIFQLQKSETPLGPWQNLTDLILDRNWFDEAAPFGEGYYRLRQW